MELPGYRKGVAKAQRLRREPTEVEKVLWRHLRDRRLGGFKFRRQVPIGRFVVDFYCEGARLIVEADGGQHAWRAAEDAVRTAFLESQGVQVLRFWNNEVMSNTEAVLQVILDALKLRSGDALR
jgi:very-short-patch-repair endonuclease